MTSPKISVLVSSRPNSQYLAKFLMSLFIKTNRKRLNCEFLIMLNKNDTWNKDTVAFFERYTQTIEKIVGFAPPIKFKYEDLGLGRAGLHTYLNMLALEAKGDWIIYFCDDHHILEPDWDEKIIAFIEERNINPYKANVVISKFDNAGAMNHMISRGMYEVLGYVGAHGWIDSYLNDVLHLSGHTERVHRMDDELFHDFTHDKPLKSVYITEQGKKLPKHGSKEYNELIHADARQLKEMIEGGTA